MTRTLVVRGCLFAFGAVLVGHFGQTAIFAARGYPRVDAPAFIEWGVCLTAVLAFASAMSRLPWLPSKDWRCVVLGAFIFALIARQSIRAPIETYPLGEWDMYCQANPEPCYYAYRARTASGTEFYFPFPKIAPTTAPRTLQWTFAARIRDEGPETLAPALQKLASIHNAMAEEPITEILIIRRTIEDRTFRDETIMQLKLENPDAS